MTQDDGGNDDNDDDDDDNINYGMFSGMVRCGVKKTSEEAYSITFTGVHVDIDDDHVNKVWSSSNSSPCGCRIRYLTACDTEFTYHPSRKFIQTKYTNLRQTYNAWDNSTPIQVHTSNVQYGT